LLNDSIKEIKRKLAIENWDFESIEYLDTVDGEVIHFKLSFLKKDLSSKKFFAKNINIFKSTIESFTLPYKDKNNTLNKLTEYLIREYSITKRV